MGILESVVYWAHCLLHTHRCMFPRSSCYMEHRNENNHFQYFLIAKSKNLLQAEAPVCEMMLSSSEDVLPCLHVICSSGLAVAANVFA